MSSTNIPSNMRAIVLQEYNANIIRVIKDLHVSEIAVPKPAANQVVVRMEAMPCNPSDIAFMRGGYAIKKTLPKVLGFEGAGTVVGAGNNAEAQKLLGKRVSCFTQDDEHGTWAEYFVTRIENCIVVNDDMDIEQAACFLINPFTAFALFETARQKGCKAIIQNAAAGQIGIFIQNMAREANIPVINIVRKDEHITYLECSGEKYVLNSQAEDFNERLATLANELNATVAFDSVGGEMTGQLFNAMPSDSEVIVIGGLSGMPATNIKLLDLIYNRKVVRGFNLINWSEKAGAEKFHQVAMHLQELIAKGTIKTIIQRKVKFEEVAEGLTQYIRNMSGGKIIIHP